MDAQERISEFRNDVDGADLKIPDGGNDRVFLVGGVVLMLAGFGMITFGWIGASGEAQLAAQFPYLISGGIIGLGLLVAGAAMFVRYSMGRYLRFWMIRQIYEQRAQTDRVVAGLESIESLMRAAVRRPSSDE